MPEWLVSIIVAACVIFIVFGMTFVIVVILMRDDIRANYRQRRDYKAWAASRRKGQ